MLVLLLPVYGFTLGRTVGSGDSTELVVALSTWGVPHAPGYPLLCLLGNVVTHLLPAPDPALPLNLLNALVAALACATLSRAVSVVTGRPGTGFVAGCALGTSRVFWLHALAIEVFALNALIAAALLLSLSHLLSSPGDPARRRLAGTTLALGLATCLTHHGTLLLIWIPVAGVAGAVVLRARERRPSLVGLLPGRSMAWIALGLLPIAYLPIASHFQPLVNWGDVHDLRSLAALLLRRDFGAGSLSPPHFVAAQVLQHGEQASPLHWRNYLLLLTRLPDAFGWAFLPLPILGLVWAGRRHPALLGLAGLFLVLLTLFFARVNLPLLPLFTSVTERFFILPHLVLAYFAGLGVALLADLGGGAARLRRLIVPAAAAITSLPMLAINGPRVDQHANVFVRDFARNLLVGVPRDAIFFTSGDLFQFGLSYQCASMRARPDVSLVSEDLAGFSWYREQLSRRQAVRWPAPAGAGAGSRVESLPLLDLNSDAAGVASGRPTVVVRFADESYLERYRMVPLGIWSRVVPRQQRLDPYGWLELYTRVASGWALESLRARADATHWEGSEDVFYRYALGQLAGLRDWCELAGGPHAPVPPVPLEALARTWDPARRADGLAFEADFLAGCLADSAMPADAPTRVRIAERALGAARMSTQLAPGNLQALETQARLLADRPELSDPRREYVLRRRIVELAPGDLSQLVPYFRLALRLGALGGPAGVFNDARRVQRRFLGLLAIAREISPGPQVDLALRRWNAPLESVPDLQ